jgi:hypothetical protein
MVHLTLNFGKYIHNPKPLLTPEIETIANGFLRRGGGAFPAPYSAYRVEIDILASGIVFLIFKGDGPISMSYGTWSKADAAEIWAEIESECQQLFAAAPQLFSVSQVPKMPDTVPWLATLLEPDFFIGVESKSPDIQFLNTFEAILFWAAHKSADARN